LIETKGNTKPLSEMSEDELMRAKVGAAMLSLRDKVVRGNEAILRDGHVEKTVEESSY